MASVTNAELLRAQKDVSNGGFLSKITRSPSRKHTLQPPIPPRGVDGPISSQDISKTSSLPQPKRAHPRPGFQRTPTAPAAPISLKSTTSDLSASIVVEASSSVTDVSDIGKAAPMTQTNSAGALPSNADQVPYVVTGPSVSGGSHGTASGSQNPNSLYQQIHDLSNKRIATLDYMRKAHEGRIHWFNTIHFSKADVSRLPSYTPNRLARRATNYFLLGLSIPAVLDMHPQSHLQSTASANSAIAQEFLRNLNNLLAEFDSFQQLHPPDGSSASSLSRARIPQMFKRATQTGGKPRRTSNAAGTDIGLPMQQIAVSPPGDHAPHHASTPSNDTTNSGNTFSSSASTLVAPSPATSMSPVAFPTSSIFPSSSPSESHTNSSLLPNEGPYTHLLTPPLPFAPDFYCVFATLCDVIIDAYQRLLQLISSPAVCNASVGDMFTKADARLRKVMVGGIMRDFEGAARESARKELLGVQRVVLGGLMGG